MTFAVRAVSGLAILFSVATQIHALDKNYPPIFDMKEMLDERTLEVEVIRDWHLVKGECPTRQKSITIRVMTLWPGQDYRIPVKMIVPADRKARGFHLTGGHNLKVFHDDYLPLSKKTDVELIKGGVGLVHTIVAEPKGLGQEKFGFEIRKRFLKTLDPHYCIQYVAWPATIMRAATAAYAETGYFEKGNVALSGGSKNGASPSVALIHDKRFTAIHATVSPIWESPLRLCDRTAWDELNTYNKEYVKKVVKGNDQKAINKILSLSFLGGTYDPNYTFKAIKEGHSWEEVQQLAVRLADDIFISKNLDQLKDRGVDMYFHPGSHDPVCFDIAWGGKHYPQLPV